MKKLLLTLGMSLFLAACGGDKAPESPQPETVQGAQATQSQTDPSTQTAGLVKVRVVASMYPPFVTKDEVGQIVGFDIDILKAIAALEGLELEITPESWSVALDTLNNNKSDVVVSAVTPNPERVEQYLASNVYISTPNSVAVPEDSSIVSIDDLKGKVVGVEGGSSFLSEKNKYPETTFKEFDTSFAALKETTTKRVDAVVAHRLHLQYLLKDKGVKMRFIDLPTSHPDKVIMLKKGNTELAQKINSGLNKIKADGTYDAIYKKWFGENAQ